jgi:hypothetical protein
VLTESSVVVRSPAPLTALVDREAVMFLPEAGQYFALGDVGSRVWELIEEPVAVGELCESLRARYDVSPSVCRDDVLPFLAELCEAGLAEVRSP